MAAIRIGIGICAAIWLSSQAELSSLLVICSPVLCSFSLSHLDLVFVFTSILVLFYEERSVRTAARFRAAANMPT